MGNQNTNNQNALWNKTLFFLFAASGKINSKFMCIPIRSEEGLQVMHLGMFLLHTFFFNLQVPLMQWL